MPLSKIMIPVRLLAIERWETDNRSRNLESVITARESGCYRGDPWVDLLPVIRALCKTRPQAPWHTCD
jgi:hypothetical protein